MGKLLKGLAFGGEISVSVLETTDMVNEGIRIHKLSPVAAAAFGRSLTACTFMASGLKNKEDKLYVNINGDGVGGRITVCGNGELFMRGSVVNGGAELPLKPNGKLDVGGFVGKNGRITVVKSMGLKEPYSGSAALVSGEIAEDFTAYFAYSEQIPTAMALGVLIGTDRTCIGAGGVIVQAMPYASESSLIGAEKAVKSLTDVSAQIKEKGAKGLMEELFPDAEYTESDPVYRCLCDKEYVKGILVSLGKKELDDIIAKEKVVKVSCEFCGKEYVFNADDVEEMFKV
ncbi:MAG: Hsp33 family molecular chaperone HslO [Clostridia bacterium]|nr:Hsp33 family molecular chaperone HslO [Clostridia bacterium]